MAQEEHQEAPRSLEERVDYGLRQLAIDPQEAVPADFSARIMARVAAMPEPHPPQWPWRRRGVPAWVLPAFATGLVLSLACNTWLGVWFFAHRGAADTSGRLRLAFVDSVPEREIRTLLLNLQATLIAGPSMEGFYTVQVPLKRLFPPRRSAEAPNSEAPNTAEQMRRLLERLRAHPAVRLAEPTSPPE